MIELCWQLPPKRSAREHPVQQRLEEMLGLALGFALLGAQMVMLDWNPPLRGNPPLLPYVALTIIDMTSKIFSNAEKSKSLKLSAWFSM